MHYKANLCQKILKYVKQFAEPEIRAKTSYSCFQHFRLLDAWPEIVWLLLGLGYKLFWLDGLVSLLARAN